MKNSLYCLIFVCLVLPLSLTAASESHRKAAAELVEMTNPKEMSVQAFMSVFEPMLTNMRGAGVEESKVAAIRAAGLKLANQVADDPDMRRKLVTVYTDTFTEPELKELIAFYQTPTGQKALIEMPALFEKGAVIGQEITLKYQEEFQETVMKILQGNGPE